MIFSFKFRLLYSKLEFFYIVTRFFHEKTKNCSTQIGLKLMLGLRLD